MGRRNANVRRKNIKGRLDRRQKGSGRLSKQHMEIPRVPVEDLILPDGQCRFMGSRPKARFATKERAQKALEQAQQQRMRLGSTHVEKRFYRCPEGGCEGYHLTSRETFDEKQWQSRRKTYDRREDGAA